MTESQPNMLSLQQFIDLHKPQLEASGVPSLYWEALHSKITNNTFDAGLNFSLMRVQYEGSDDLGWRVVVSNPDGVSADENCNVYLIDHAWTYNQKNARQMLKEHEGLLERMALLMEIDKEDYMQEEDLITAVLCKQWLFNQTYSLGNYELGSDESLPVWYIMDELGARIQHSDDPTVKCVPFMYSPTQTAYTIFWLLKDLKENDEITRDYMPSVPADEELQRLAHLLPWSPCDFTEIDDDQEEPGENYFKMSKYEDTNLNLANGVDLSTLSKIKVWTSDHIVAQYLTCDRFQLTENREEAHIVWQMSHLKDFKELGERSVYINQFPYESLLTTKDMLAVIARRAANTGEKQPKWLATTYNLTTELPEFICHYQKRKENSENNYWIAKPWNLGRGLGIEITDDINCLVRLPESGPYVAVKYLEKPVLYTRPDIGEVKFDYRYIVLLKSVKPLRLSVLRTFYIRFANKEFSMDSFDDYDKHFTVHNYSNPEKLLNVNCEEFVPEWDRQYPAHCWADIETDTMQCIRELFEAAVSKEPPFGIGESPLSRAHYAMDFMLKWDTDNQGRKIVVPQVLECNFCPDSSRGCKNYPDYFNIVFLSLFLDDDENKVNEIVLAGG